MCASTKSTASVTSSVHNCPSHPIFAHRRCAHHLWAQASALLVSQPDYLNLRRLFVHSVKSNPAFFWSSYTSPSIEGSHNLCELALLVFRVVNGWFRTLNRRTSPWPGAKWVHTSVLRMVFQVPSHVLLNVCKQIYSFTGFLCEWHFSWNVRSVVHWFMICFLLLDHVPIPTQEHIFIQCIWEGIRL